MDTSHDSLACDRRERSIRWAVAMSLMSKAGTAALQLLAIPIAIRVLGRAEFGLYASVNLTLTTVALFEVGVGPALAHGLAHASANGEREKLRVLASTSFFLMLGIALLVGLCAVMFLANVSVGQIYGEGFAGREAILKPALWLGLGLFLMLFLLNLTERIREGYLEVAATNAFGAAGNVLAALVVGIGVRYVPHVWFLVIAIHGSVVTAKLANTAVLWWKRSDMIPSPDRFRVDVAKHLFSDGLAFSTCCLLTGIVEFNVCGWMVGRAGGPSAVALFGVLVTLTVMQGGFIMMLSTPTWPAVAEALARRDSEWARRAAKKLYLYGVVFALASAGGLTLLGPWLFRHWLGREFSDVGRGLFACYGIYFLAHVWRHLNHTLMIGTGQVKRMARVQLAETAIVVVVAWVGLHTGGLEVMLLAMAGTLLAVTGRILPGMVASAWEAGNDPPEPEPRPA
jgi:O-antigen/teichoic acid export membrane protein